MSPLLGGVLPRDPPECPHVTRQRSSPLGRMMEGPQRTREVPMAFDVDELISGCTTALADPEPRRAVREVLAEAMEAPGEVADSLRPDTGGITLLHQTPELSILHVV